MILPVSMYINLFKLKAEIKIFRTTSLKGWIEVNKKADRVMMSIIFFKEFNGDIRASTSVNSIALKTLELFQFD